MKIHGVVKSVKNLDEEEAKISILGPAFLAAINLINEITSNDAAPYVLEIKKIFGPKVTALYIGSKSSPPQLGDEVKGISTDIYDHPGNKGADIELTEANFFKPEAPANNLQHD